jgi:hypothetical protein
MPFRYAPLPNHTSIQDRELEASFEAEDSDVEDHDTPTESHPLNPSRSRSPPPATTNSSTSYNFEDLDYDYPPPGKPSMPFGRSLDPFGQAPLPDHLALRYQTMA